MFIMHGYVLILYKTLNCLQRILWKSKPTENDTLRNTIFNAPFNINEKKWPFFFQICGSKSTLDLSNGSVISRFLSILRGSNFIYIRKITLDRCKFLE